MHKLTIEGSNTNLFNWLDEPLPPGMPIPLVKGEYLGTKPYYFKNITPVLEFGKPAPCVEYYYGIGYEEFNQSLQGMNGRSLDTLEDLKRQYLEDLILQIQVKGKLYKNLYRGIRGDTVTPKYFKMKVGDTFIKEGFTSTSLSENVAENFALWGTADRRSVMLHLDPTPSSIGLLITNIKENEVLFPPRTGWTITEIQKSGDYDRDFGKKKLRIYARLFTDPAFKILNRSGKSIKSIT